MNAVKDAASLSGSAGTVAARGRSGSVGGGSLAWAAAIFGVLSLAMGGIFARVVSLQTQPPEGLVEQMSDRTSVRVERGRRGDVLDRRGRPLAATRFGFRAILDPSEFPVKDTFKHLELLSEVLGQPLETVGPRVLNAMGENERRAKAIAEHAQIELMLTEEEKQEELEEQARAREAAGSEPMGESAEAAARNVNEGVAAGAAEGLDVHGMSAKPVWASKPPRLIRYLVMSEVLSEGQVERIKRAKIPGLKLETRPVREMVSPEIAAAMVGKVNVDGQGLLAMEKLLDERLEAKDGSFKFVRDAKGRPLWVEPGAYTPPQRGEDVRLSLDLELQRIVREELERGVEEADAQGGRAILIDSVTGEILAIADTIRKPADVVEYDWATVIPKDKRLDGPRYITVRNDPGRSLHPALAHNRVVEDLYEPGSTFKPFMWAASTELGLARPEEVFNTHWGQWATPYGRPIKDVVKRATMTWREVLINSSNIGMVQGTARMTFEQMRGFVLAFGFGQRTNIGVPGESVGMVTGAKGWSKYTQTSVAFGHEVAVTPLQMARAFAAFSRPGEMAGTLPSLTLLAREVGADGRITPDLGKRVISTATAEETRQTLRGVTQNLDKKLAAREVPETGWRYELFGKSGTADIPMTNPPPGKKKPKGSDGYFRGQYNASFVAGGPAESPRLVCVVVIDDPGRELIRKKAHYGTYVSGPVVRRIMDKSLAYLGVPASMTPTSAGPAHAD